MARISEEEINAVRTQADIVDVISHYIQVHRKGKSYVSICPFHDDHDPSMSISPGRQIYKCFVCGSGGNVFTFVQNYEKVSFPEAVGRVAGLIGYHLSVTPDEVKPVIDPRKDTIYRVLNETINFTTYQLETNNAQREREYLNKRGLDERVRKVFEIGYDPSGNALSRFLIAKGYQQADLIAANVSRMSGSVPMDVFENRITFPIHDTNGNPIGFSARSIDPDNKAKYINTNETDVFVKGNIVYNYHRARMSARKEGKVYVCEGVTDVISFYRAGLENAVCTLGTSCTEQQLRLLKNMAAKIVFCYDGDRAGQAATYKAAKAALTLGCDVGIVFNVTGRDPDEIIRSDGAEGLKNLVKNEITWMEFVLKYLSENTNLSNYGDKKEMIRKAQAEIALLPDEMDRRYFTEQLSEITKIHIEYTPAIQTQPVRFEESHKISSVPNGTIKAQEQILTMMLANQNAVRIFEEKLGFLIGKDEQTLAMLIVNAAHSRKRTDPLRLIDETDSQQIKNLISRLLTSDLYHHEFNPAIMNGAIRKVQKSVLDAEAAQYRQQLTMELNDMSRELILNKYHDCLNKLRRLIDDENEENK